MGQLHVKPRLLLGLLLGGVEVLALQIRAALEGAVQEVLVDGRTPHPVLAQGLAQEVVERVLVVDRVYQTGGGADVAAGGYVYLVQIVGHFVSPSNARQPNT